MNTDKKNKNNDNRTSIAPYSSWGLTGQFDSIFDDFKRSFDQLMTPLTPLFDNSDLQSARAPFIDLLDEGTHYRVTAELPGFTKDKVDVQVTKNGLLLHAEKKDEKEDKGENYLRRERGYSVLERSLSFPEEVNPEKVEGTVNNGVLELRVPKREVKLEEKPKRVQLK